MTEIPEHLLQRSKERRKALGLPVPGEEGGEAEAPAGRGAPPTAAATAEAPAAAPAAAAASAPAERRRAPRAAPRSPPTCSSGAQAPAALAGGGGGGGADVRRRRRRRAPPRPPPRCPAPTDHRPRAVTRSGCSRSSSRGRSSRPAPRRRTRCTPGRTCSSIEFAAILIVTAGAHHLLGAGAGAAARPRRLQQDAEPVEGAVVLPRAAGAAHHVPPDGRGRDHPGHGARSC